VSKNTSKEVTGSPLEHRDPSAPPHLTTTSPTGLVNAVDSVLALAAPESERALLESRSLGLEDRTVTAAGDDAEGRVRNAAIELEGELHGVERISIAPRRDHRTADGTAIVRRMRLLDSGLVASVIVPACVVVAACGGAADNTASPTSPTAVPTSTTATPAATTAAAPSGNPAGSDAAGAAAHVVAATDRSSDDRALDGGRHPQETLTFFGIAPGMRVGVGVAAGFGYTTELLARDVGPGGKVYAENNKLHPREVRGEGLVGAAREAGETPTSSAADRELEDPFPPEAKGSRRG